MRSGRLCAILLAVLLSPAVAPAADDVPALVKKTIDAYGGEAALRKAAAFRETGTVVSTVRGGATGTVTRLFQRPAKLRVEIAFKGEEPEIRVVNDGKGWRAGREVDGPPLQAMVLQAARLALPLSLLDRKDTLEERAPVERDGRRLRVLELPVGVGMDMSVEIDPETGRILRTSGVIRGVLPGDGTIDFVTTYDDFRKAGGILFAFKEMNYAMGRLTGETTLEEVEVSASLPATTFTP